MFDSATVGRPLRGTGSALHGLRVGLLESRYAHELAALVERVGGVPLMAPCLREVRTVADRELRSRLESIASDPPDVFVFQTGVGVEAMFDLAKAAGVAEPLADAVRHAFVVARGPKPLTVLLRLGFRVSARTPKPHTTKELFWLLEGVKVSSRRVVVQHYGSANLELVDSLRGRGADVVEVFSYRWALPDDLSPIVHLLDELSAGRVAVTAFTSTAQAENLCTVAAGLGLGDELVAWLNERTVVASIGPTCARALERRGIAVVIQPDIPKMVPFVRAIRDHFSAGAAGAWR